MNSDFKMSMTSNFGSTSEKVGVTTTVKEQVQNIEITIQHFKKCLQAQRKQQNQLDNQLNKLHESTQNDFKNMLNQVKMRSKQLNQSFTQQNTKYIKETQYIQLQKKILEDEHSKLHQLSSHLGQRVNEMEENVGI